MQSTAHSCDDLARSFSSSTSSPLFLSSLHPSQCLSSMLTESYNIFFRFTYCCNLYCRDPCVLVSCCRYACYFFYSSLRTCIYCFAWPTFILCSKLLACIFCSKLQIRLFLLHCVVLLSISFSQSVVRHYCHFCIVHYVLDGDRCWRQCYAVNRYSIWYTISSIFTVLSEISMIRNGSIFWHTDLLYESVASCCAAQVVVGRRSI